MGLAGRGAGRVQHGRLWKAQRRAHSGMVAGRGDAGDEGAGASATSARDAGAGVSGGGGDGGRALCADFFRLVPGGGIPSAAAAVFVGSPQGFGGAADGGGAAAGGGACEAVGGGLRARFVGGADEASGGVREIGGGGGGGCGAAAGQGGTGGWRGLPCACRGDQPGRALAAGGGFGPGGAARGRGGRTAAAVWGAVAAARDGADAGAASGGPFHAARKPGRDRFGSCGLFGCPSGQPIRGMVHGAAPDLPRRAGARAGGFSG